MKVNAKEMLDGSIAFPIEFKDKQDFRMWLAGLSAAADFVDVWGDKVQAGWFTSLRERVQKNYGALGMPDVSVLTMDEAALFIQAAWVGLSYLGKAKELLDIKEATINEFNNLCTTQQEKLEQYEKACRVLIDNVKSDESENN